MVIARIPRVALRAALLSIVGGAASLAPALTGLEERPSVQPGGPRVIDVVASRFAFEPSTIEVAVGERVQLVMRSADGVHGLEIRKFRVNREIPRGGTPVTIEFIADTAGRFPIVCSEFCGDGHEEMTGTLVVRASDDQAP